MSFYKVYPNRKDHRKQPYGSKAIDSSCRNHGDCPWCAQNRKHKEKKREPLKDSQLFEDFEQFNYPVFL